jgi:hypothetical protein
MRKPLLSLAETVPQTDKVHGFLDLLTEAALLER